MSSSKPTEERTVESADDCDVSTADGHDVSTEDDHGVSTEADHDVSTEDHHGVPPEVLATSIRNKTAAIDQQGDVLADRLERLADADDAEALDAAPVMTELLETASDLVAVAHEIEAARLHE